MPSHSSSHQGASVASRAAAARGDGVLDRLRLRRERLERLTTFVSKRRGSPALIVSSCLELDALRVRLEARDVPHVDRRVLALDVREESLVEEVASSAGDVASTAPSSTSPAQLPNAAA